MDWIVFAVNVILDGTIIAVALSGVLVLLEIGRRIRSASLRKKERAHQKVSGRIEGAISRLLELILAFSFSGTLAVSGGNGGTGDEVTGGTTINAGRCSLAIGSATGSIVIC
jgi:hypothetical protein